MKTVIKVMDVIDTVMNALPLEVRRRIRTKLYDRQWKNVVSDLEEERKIMISRVMAIEETIMYLKRVGNE